MQLCIQPADADAATSALLIVAAASTGEEVCQQGEGSCQQSCQESCC